MNIPDWKVVLWNAVNRYAQTCGGDPSKHVYGNTSRQLAVVEVERAIDAAVAEAVAAEREACAETADQWAEMYKNSPVRFQQTFEQPVKRVAERIRARSSVRK